MQDKLNFIHEASGAPVKGLVAMGEQAASVAKTALELYKQALNMQNACQVVAETQQSMNELHHEFAQHFLMAAESQQSLPNQPNTTNQPKMTNFPMARADVSHVPLQLHPRPLSFTPGEDLSPPPYSFFNPPPPYSLHVPASAHISQVRSESSTQAMANSSSSSHISKMRNQLSSSKVVQSKSKRLWRRWKK